MKIQLKNYFAALGIAACTFTASAQKIQKYIDPARYGNGREDWGVDFMVTRYTDVLMLMAECTLHGGGGSQAEVDDIYMDFLNRVAEGRGMTTDQVNTIARGRVWTGTDALRVGLVDELGGLKDAINYAAKTAGVKEAKVLYYPFVEEDPFEAIMEQLEDSKKNSSVSMSGKMPVELMKQYEKLVKLESMSGIQMRMPFVIDFK